MNSQRFVRWRAASRAATTIAFVAVVLVAAAMAGANGADRGRLRFSHVYPPNPGSLERPKATNPAPRAARALTIGGAQRIASLRQLAAVLPPTTLRNVGGARWRLTAPVDVTKHSRLLIRGGTLDLAPGVFLQARDGGTVVIENAAVTAVGIDGGPMRVPTPDRGFLVARDGGVLVLRHDRIASLGHLGTVAYGISFRAPGPGSTVTDSAISGNYFGIFMSQAAGVFVVGNTISDSTVYGIDPYGGSHDIVISHNTVVRSGLHAIVLANQVSHIRVIDNQINDAGTHGIVLFGGATRNVVLNNTIAHVLDGIVVTDSSRNRISGNSIDNVTRFGIRMAAGSSLNTFNGNSISHALLGAYVYGGAFDNALLRTTFAHNRENVRVRSDAARTLVDPRPNRSELP